MGSADAILLSAGPGELRLAVMAGDRPLEFLIDRGDGNPGDVVLGRVLSVNRAIDAAFIDIGEPTAGFLAPAGPAAEGQPLLVQVTAAARAGKGAELTRAVSLAGQVIAYTPARAGLNVSRRITADDERARLTAVLKPVLTAGEGVVVRTQAAGTEAGALLAELDTLRRRWQAIEAARAVATPPARLHAPHPLTRLLGDYPDITRVVVDSAALLADIRPLFAAAELCRDAFDEVADDLDAALDSWVPLPGGGTLIIEFTAALTVIDIDSGGGSALDANLAAVPEIARQLRLRGVAGHVILDIIPLRDRRALGRIVEALRQAVADDPTPTHVIGTTPLGLVEMTRERRRPTLAETMLDATPARRSADSLGLDALRALLREADTRPGARLALAASPEVVTALRRRPAALAQAADRLGRPLTLKEQQGLDLPQVIEDRP
jgi:Rne/Rng family ribonuclease